VSQIDQVTFGKAGQVHETVQKEAKNPHRLAAADPTRVPMRVIDRRPADIRQVCAGLLGI
jgi:type II secretory pathway component PulC